MRSLGVGPTISVAIVVLACGKASVCPTLPAIPAERAATPPAVKIDNCDGSAGECGRAEQVRAELEKIVASPELECLVTTFDQDHPFGQLGTEKLLDDCNGPNPPLGRGGLIGYRESRCNQPALGNDEIDRLFRASPSDCGGKLTGTIHLNPRFDFGFSSKKNYEVAGDWVHEHLLHLGFCEQGREQQSQLLVPYVYGFAACLVGAKVEDGGAKPLSAYRAACQGQLGPGFRP
ncbi:MAG: hypothetical protein U0270_18580 [Labilithrix sp.]